MASCRSGHINTLDVGAITGNSSVVASKHYRAHETIRYIEAIYMITIGDVTIQGEIVRDEKEIEDLPQVEYGAGACKSSECIKLEIDTEDSDYKCLTCKKFVTSINRAHVFEKRLNVYKFKKEKAESSLIQQYYHGLAKLYAAFLKEILDKEKGVTDI